MRGSSQDQKVAKTDGGDLLDSAEVELGGGGLMQVAQVGGEIPAVHTDATAAAGPTASQQAYDQGEDENVKELKAKVGALVQNKFGGDYRKAFDHYDEDKDGGVNKDEIVQLLKDAGVGNGLTRGAWAKGILKKVDQGKDGKIQWAEFDVVFRG
jgi:hypothetical protein